MLKSQRICFLEWGPEASGPMKSYHLGLREGHCPHAHSMAASASAGCHCLPPRALSPEHPSPGYVQLVAKSGGCFCPTPRRSRTENSLPDTLEVGPVNVCASEAGAPWESSWSSSLKFSQLLSSEASKVLVTVG